jgi:hypothetical protein
MKPFNLEAALGGAKVINSKQEPVTDIAYFPSSNCRYRVYGVVDGKVYKYSETTYLFHKGNNDFTRDLFMAPVMKEGWINIYKGGRIGHYLYKTEEDARASCWPGLIACIRIEWEE